MRRINLGVILFLSLTLTIALTAVFYLAQQLFGTAMPAFDIMNFLIRNLPGDVITTGIDTMTDAILEIRGPENLDSAAKNAENVMAILNMLVIGTGAGVVIALILSAWRGARESFYALGAMLGLLAGVILALISSEYNFSATVDPGISSVWIIVACTFWGWALAMLLEQYSALPDEGTVPAAIPVGAAAPLIAPASVQVLDRRQFLIRVGASTAAVTLVGAGLGALLATQDTEEEIATGLNLEPTSLDDALEPAPGTRPEYTPLEDHYRIDINAGGAPRVQEDGYRMRLHGLVDEDIELSLDEIRAETQLVQFITLGCISNRVGGTLISTTRWTGTPMKNILAKAALKPEATHIKISSADRFYEIVAIADIMNDERIMLAYEWDGIPLTMEHGFPLRIYLPNRYGMKQPKWITDMEFIDGWEPGYWVERGWSQEAMIQTTSVVDTIAVNDITPDNLIPVGGIAWAGARGISRVEVRVDDGEWETARMRAPLSETTWVLWRYDWEFTEGDHTFTVRCVDGDGTPQIAEEAGVRPDGATGYHSRDAEV
jgi:DMSO/TMAO reductase YedYZ molybdopterin-dependent catalytic subunit